MNKLELKELVQQVAEIQDLSPKKDPNIRLDDHAEELVRHDNTWIELNSKTNPTLGFKLVKLKEKHRLCELDCGDLVANQVVERRLAFTPEKHWRTRCQNCAKFVSPDGVGFIEGGHAVAAAYTRYFKGLPVHDFKVKPRNSGHNENSQEYLEIPTNDGIIRKYK